MSWKILIFRFQHCQRDVVWEKENVKKLWDSIYKFYPLGSILVWKTNIKLQNPRKIGGHTISEGTFIRSEYQYILDGQQRTTSLLTSLYGGVIEGKDGFDPSVYIDLSSLIQIIQSRKRVLRKDVFENFILNSRANDSDFEKFEPCLNFINTQINGTS